MCTAGETWNWGQTAGCLAPENSWDKFFLLSVLEETKNRKAFCLFLLISIIFFRERDGESVSCGVVGGRRAEGERES